MSVVYVITTPILGAANRYKVGHLSKGHRQTFDKRYITSLPDYILCFVQETEYSREIESCVLQYFHEKRVRNCNGNLSEWIETRCEDLINFIRTMLFFSEKIKERLKEKEDEETRIISDTTHERETHERETHEGETHEGETHEGETHEVEVQELWESKETQSVEENYEKETVDMDVDTSIKFSSISTINEMKTDDMDVDTSIKFSSISTVNQSPTKKKETIKKETTNTSSTTSPITHYENQRKNILQKICCYDNEVFKEDPVLIYSTFFSSAPRQLIIFDWLQRNIKIPECILEGLIRKEAETNCIEYSYYVHEGDKLMKLAARFGYTEYLKKLERIFGLEYLRNNKDLFIEALKGGHNETINFLISKDAFYNVECLKIAIERECYEFIEWLLSLKAKEMTEILREKYLKIVINEGSMKIISNLLFNRVTTRPKLLSLASGKRKKEIANLLRCKHL